MIKEMISSDDLTHLPGVSLPFLKEAFTSFIPYDVTYTDMFNFQKGFRIKVGKCEKITNSKNLIECIIENSHKRQLLILNVWFDAAGNTLDLPEYLYNSTNVRFVVQTVKRILGLNLRYQNNIAGYIFDPNLLEDVKKNFQSYAWERGIPATQFAPAIGYLRIIERYRFAARYIHKTDLVLDAACGFGYGSAYFSRAANHITSLDLAGENILFGRNTYGFKNIDWIEGDVTKIPFENSMFDIYTSFETLEHLSLDIVSLYFEEALRVLKVGGRMIISTPNIENRRHIKNPYHVKEYTSSEFKGLLDQYFKDVKYFSTDNFSVTPGIGDKAVNMIAVCCNTK